MEHSAVLVDLNLVDLVLVVINVTLMIPEGAGVVAFASLEKEEFPGEL